jgi:hypothetical protein
MRSPRAAAAADRAGAARRRRLAAAACQRRRLRLAGLAGSADPAAARGSWTDFSARLPPALREALAGSIRRTAPKPADGRCAGSIGRRRRAGARGAGAGCCCFSPAARPAGAVPDDADAFLYSVSHDLRAPIRVIEGFARILKEDYGRCSTASATITSTACSAPRRACTT